MVNVESHSNFHRLAATWGFHYYPPNDYHFDTVLCCKARVRLLSVPEYDPFPEIGNLSMRIVDAETTDEPVPRIRRRASSLEAQVSSRLLPYVIRQGWIMSYHGVEVRRVAWFPSTADHTLEDLLIRSDRGDRFSVVRLIREESLRRETERS